MSGISSLWRVRGSIPVPNHADDSGLISRVGHIFEEFGATVTDENQDALRYAHDREQVGLVLALDGGEVRREGIRGLRVLRYDVRMPGSLLYYLIKGGIFAALLWFIFYELGPPVAIDPRLTLAVPPLASVGYFILMRAFAGARVRAKLRRAF